MKFLRSGRERGIRTPGGVTLNGFQDRRFQPLSHLPQKEIQSKKHLKSSEVKNLIKSLTKFGGDTRSRTEEWKLCRLLPYHLAMSPLANPYLKSCAKTPKNLRENLKNTKIYFGIL